MVGRRAIDPLPHLGRSAEHHTGEVTVAAAACPIIADLSLGFRLLVVFMSHMVFE